MVAITDARNVVIADSLNRVVALSKQAAKPGQRLTAEFKLRIKN